MYTINCLFLPNSYDWVSYGFAFEKGITPGKAIDYTLPRIEKLKVYTTDGKLQIDNNLVENAIRPIALGYA